MLYDKSYLKYSHCLSESAVIVDVGANLGLESIKLFSLYPNSNIILIEPQEFNCDFINKYIENNNLNDKWKVFKCAVDIVDGFKEFGYHHFMSDGRLNGSLDPFNWQRWNYEGTTTVETKRFENICKNPSIIKMDIERHEYIVLPEICKNTNIEIMYIELHGPCYDLNIIDFFDNCLKDSGLEITGWYEVHQSQTSNIEDDNCKKINPQEYIPCSGSASVIIERKKC